MFKGWSDREELTKEAEQKGERWKERVRVKEEMGQCLSNHTGRHSDIRIKNW